MKPNFLIAPVVAFLIVGAWTAMQRQSIAALDQKSALLRNHLATARASAGSGAPSHGAKAPSARPAKDNEPIDWEKAAALMAKMQGNVGMNERHAMIHLQQRVRSMTTEELVVALDEIAKLPASLREELEQLLIGPLIEKDPELALSRFSARLQDPRAGMDLQLASAFGKWAEKDSGKATAWFDAQIAAGKFDSTSLDGKSPARILFEGEMLRLLIGSDMAAAEARLANLPEDQYKAILSSSAGKVKEQDQKAFADLVRNRLSGEETGRSIAMIAGNLASKGYPEVSAYLDRIAATPEERAKSAGITAALRMKHDVSNGIITREDIDKMREWVTTQAPGKVDTVTGKALAGAVGEQKFADVAALALHYQASSGNDDVLVGFIDSWGSAIRMDGTPVAQNREELIELADKISDPARREEVLKKLR